jgi:hypothetical protein
MDGPETLTEELICDVESQEFADLAHLAAGERAFVRMIARNPTFHQLVTAARFPLAQGRIIRRIRYLSEADVDPSYENQWDSAISAYVLSMMLAGNELGYIAGVEARRTANAWFLQHILTASSDGLLAPLEDVPSPRVGVEFDGAGQRQKLMPASSSSLSQRADAATFRTWPLSALFRSALSVVHSGTITKDEHLPAPTNSDSTSIQVSQ